MPVEQEVPNPIIPFEARTTPGIDRANRLIGLRSHPGWNDLMALSLETVRIAEAAVVEYAGWDKDELVARSIAFRAAKKSHEMLLVRMATAIQDGVREVALAQQDKPLNDPQVADMADELRAEVLRQIDEYDSRVPGSY